MKYSLQNSVEMVRQHLILIFMFCIFFFTTKLQVEGIFSSVKTRRTQSMRPLTYHKTENKLNTRSGSLSSISSASSLSEQKVVDPHPIASTSYQKELESKRLKEVDLHPLVDETKKVSFNNPIELNEASVSTHSDGRINPARDGVFARVRNTFLSFGSAVAIGSAIGALGAVADQRFIHNNISETSMYTANATLLNATFEQHDFDEIINPL